MKKPPILKFQLVIYKLLSAIFLSVCIIFSICVYRSFAEVPCKINYQGRLIKDNVPVHNPTPGVPMTFKVDGEDVYSGGNVPVYNGLFRVVLDLEGIDWTAGEEKSLEVTVDGELLSPAEPIYAYPYAINSHLLEGKTTDYFLNTSGETQKKDGGLNIMGNVGIGTTSPSPLAKLDIRDETSKSNVFIGGDGVSESNTAVIYTGGADKLQLGSNNSYDDLVIDRNGNVGIGTTNPGATLDVNGSLKIGGGTAIKKVQLGYIGDGSTGYSAGSSGDVVFSPHFSTIPLIFLTIDEVSGDNDGASSARVIAKSLTGFSWNSFIGNTQYAADGIFWIAVEIE